MATTVAYQTGMSIGRVFDMRTFACGLNIFSRDDIAKTSTVERHSNTVKYSVIKGSRDVNNILGISGDISLKAKAGIIDVEGVGSYLKEDRSQDNVMEILARAQVETVTVSMDDATPKEGWATNANGTHYIRSIIYGGDLVVRIRIKGSDARQMEEIKGKVQGGLATHGIIDAKAQAEFKKLEQDIKSNSEIDIEYHSTTPKGEMPRDINGMLRALDSFKTDIQQLNDNKGVPCKCEIVPLHYLDATIPAILKSSAYISQINSLEEKYDDVQIAKKKLHSFLQEVEDDIEPELETDACHLEERIDEALERLMEVISEIDITSQQQTVDKIKEARSSNQMKGAGGFHREVNKFVRTCAGPKISDGKDLNIVIIGTSGQGKSETGNTILGDNAFDAHACSETVTKLCQEKYSFYGTRRITVLDTPHVNPNKQGNLRKEIEDFYKLHRPNAILVVLRWNTRFTREQEEIFAIMDEVSSKGELSNHTVLVFTHGDTFHPEIRSHDAKIQKFKEHMMSEEGIIKRLLEKVGGRFILVNNMEISKLKRQREAALIIEQIDNLMVNTTIVAVQDEDEDGFTAISPSRGTYGCSGSSSYSLLEHFPDTMACFPQNAEVVSHTNGTILMKDIQIGEQLMSVSSNGEITYSPVFLFGHANSNVTSEFINIITRQVSIKLSPDHHIYSKYDNQIVTVPSRQITRGNVIFRLDSNNNRLVEDEVTDICFCIEKGLYAPFTMSGTLVVEGVLASCYVDCVPPNWAHPLLWPVRLMYRMSPSFLAWISKPQTNGIPNWIHWIMETLIKKKLH
ncbi:uncharacterized protein [Haliotis cracherodii]|uniref:uncharacterized protein isoform X2 n=1 Tax=Haliotis cracherodii TaxID=6455 RepID=UPI0039EA8C3C